MSSQGHGGSPEDWIVDSRGHRSWRCQAPARSTGKRCRNPAMRDRNVCRIHGGKTKPHVAKAAKARTEREASKLLARLDVRNADPLSSPVESVIRLGGQVEALKDQALARLAQVDIDDPRFTVAMAAASKVIDQASSLLVDINRLGLEERRIELDETRNALAAAAITATLKRFDLDVTATEVRNVLAVELAAAEKRLHR